MTFPAPRPLNLDEGLAIIPEHCRVGMRRYIDEHIRPGGFLSAVLSNDLMSALRTADELNSVCLGKYAKFLHYYAPQDCYGSREKVAAWVAARPREVEAQL